MSERKEKKKLIVKIAIAVVLSFVLVGGFVLILTGSKGTKSESEEEHAHHTEEDYEDLKDVSELADIETDSSYVVPDYASNTTGKEKPSGTTTFDQDGLKINIPSGYSYAMHNDFGSGYEIWSFSADDKSSVFYISREVISEKRVLAPYENLKAYANMYGVLNYSVSDDVYGCYFTTESDCAGYMAFVYGETTVYSVRFETIDSTVDIKEYRLVIQSLSDVLLNYAGGDR